MVRFMHTVDLWLSPRWSVYFWGEALYFLNERWPKCADLWTFGKDWWVSFFSSTFKTINTTIFVAYLMYGAFVYVWILCFVSTFFFFTNWIHILVLPRTIHFTTCIPRSYQILLAKFWCVCGNFFGGRLKCNSFTCLDRKYHHPNNRNHRSRAFWKCWN